MGMVFEKTGQASIEYILLVATLLGVSAVMLVYTLSSYDTAVEIDKMDTALEKLSLLADKAYALGPGSAVIDSIVLPENVEHITVERNRIEAKAEGSINYVLFDFNVCGSLPTQEGFHKIKAEAVDENVEFSEVVE